MKKTGKIIIFIILLSGFIILGVFINDSFYAMGGIFAYFAISFAYNHLFKKSKNKSEKLKLKK
jgi:hypothetical protein